MTPRNALELEMEEEMLSCALSIDFVIWSCVDDTCGAAKSRWMPLRGGSV